jgi:hypothetical protein
LIGRTHGALSSKGRLLSQESKILELEAYLVGARVGLLNLARRASGKLPAVPSVKIRPFLNYDRSIGRAPRCSVRSSRCLYVNNRRPVPKPEEETQQRHRSDYNSPDAQPLFALALALCCQCAFFAGLTFCL